MFALKNSVTGQQPQGWAAEFTLRVNLMDP